MKTKLLLLGIFYSMLTYAQVPTTGLVAEYLFNGASLNDTGGSTNLTLTGSLLSAEANRAGGTNRAINLNGDHLQRTGTTGNTITLSFWIKTTTNDALKRVIIDQSERTSTTETSSQTGWYAYLQNGKVGVAGSYEWYHWNNSAAGASGYSGYVSTEASTVLSDGNWHHVAIALTPFAGSWYNAPYARYDNIISMNYKVYVDNVLKVSYDQLRNIGNATHPTLRRFVTPTLPITIANSKNLNSTNRYANIIDDIRYYNRTLTAAEITALATEAGDATAATITKAGQTITFNALPAKTVGDAAFNLTATTTSGLPINYTSSNTAVATVSGNTVTIVGVGSTNITASQAGNIQYDPASSVQNSLVVNQASQTISFAGPTARMYGDPDFSLSATTTSGLPITFVSSNTAVATVSGNTITITGVGSTLITASQSGNANYAAASPVQRTFTVNKASQIITFNALPAKTVGDPTFNLSATSSSGLPVSYTSSNTSVATVSGNTVTILNAGVTTITATQAGDANYNAASSIGRSLTVNKAAQTITFNPLASKAFGEPAFSLSATASSGLPITCQSSNTAVATVSGTTITIVGAGNTTITATQSGNANYFAASQVQQVLTINKADQTIAFSPITSVTFGDASFTVSANASSGLTVSYTSSNTNVATVTGNTITIVGAGSATIAANQAGNNNFNGATEVQQVLVVNKAAQTITFGTQATGLLPNGTLTLTGSTSSGLPLSYSSSNASVATVSGNVLTLLSEGSTTITATQSGNANYEAALSVDQVVTVIDKLEQSIQFTALPAKTFGDPAFQLNATSTSSLPVSFTSSNTNVATVSGTTVTIIGAGSATITASQPGNSFYDVALPVSQELIVSKATQTITFTSAGTINFSQQSVSLSPTTTSGLPVLLSSSNTNVATVSGSIVTFVTPGSITLTASQSGSNNYLAAADVVVAITITDDRQGITLSGSIDFGNVLKQESATKTLTITNTGNLPLEVSSIQVPDGFSASLQTGTIASGASLPVTITFSPTEIKSYDGNIIVESNAVHGLNESGISSVNVKGTGVTITGFNEPGQPVGELEVYPNPGAGIFKIIGVRDQNKSVVITSVTGQTYTRESFDSGDLKYEINISDLPNGVYYLCIQHKGIKAVKRIVKLNQD